MQTTTNIGLKTYEANDPTDWLGEFNYNMNKIDTAVGTQNQEITLISADVTTAVNTANTANSTASEALQTANTKASINDSVASATNTYSSNKINELISGIEPGTEIDDSVTSTTKTWSSSKINTEITAVETVANSKASINDTTAGSTTTYSSNKINDLLDDINPIPYTGNSITSTQISLTDLTTEQSGITARLTAGYYYLTAFVRTSGTGSLFIHFRNGSNIEILQGEYQEVTRTHYCITPIFYVPENGYFNVALHSTSDNFTSLGSVTLHKVN